MKITNKPKMYSSRSSRKARKAHMRRRENWMPGFAAFASRTFKPTGKLFS
jgi:hypothetical protein